MKLWIIGSLRDCTSESHNEALSEVATIGITSLVPVWIGMLVAFAFDQRDGASGVLFRFLSSNEAIIYCAALVGPLAYTLTKSYGKLAGNLTIRFPHALFFIIALLIVYGSAVGIFGTDLASTHNIEQLSTNQFHPPHFWKISAAFLVSSFAILYVAYTLRNNIPEEASDLMRQDSEKFVKEWQK